MGSPNAGKGPLDVVVVYAFDRTTITPDFSKVLAVHTVLLNKLIRSFPGSCFSYIHVYLASNQYAEAKIPVTGYQAMSAAIPPVIPPMMPAIPPVMPLMMPAIPPVMPPMMPAGIPPPVIPALSSWLSLPIGKPMIPAIPPALPAMPLGPAANGSFLPYTMTGCTKNMASGLPEAHRLINLSSENRNGIILLFSNGLANNKGDFFDKAEEFVSTVPVHTFTLGSDAYNQGLCTIAANSPGGSFNSIPIPYKPEESLPLMQRLDGILNGTMNDDEKPATWNSGSTKSLVSINRVKYFKDDAALTADTVTAEVEIKATSSTAVREGLDLVTVLDVSGRMEKKMHSVKNAMKFVIMKLTPVDRLSIVIFSDGAARLTPLRSMTPAAQAELVALVDGLTARGGTNIRAGLENGLAVVAGRVNTNARTANVFLMSDGRQTVSDARRVDPGQVPVYTFGFGGDVDHRLLSDLAGRSHGGMFSAVSEGASLSVPFSQLLGGLLTVVAQDVRLTLTPKTDDGDVGAMAVVPGTNYTQAVDTATGVITIMFGTLFAGEGRKVVVTLDLKDSAATEEYDASLAEAQHMFTAQGRVMQKQLPQDIEILRVQKPSQAPGASAMARQLQAELARRAQAEAIRQARDLADADDLEEARYKLVDAQNALEDVVLSDGASEKLVTALRDELVQLIRLMDSKKIYEEKGRAYALASEASHGRQRYAARGGGGGGDDDVRLFSTPRMDAYLEQAKNFDKDPAAPVPSADEDVKKEIAANPLATISDDLAYYLRNAIEALQAMEKIIAPRG